MARSIASLVLLAALAAQAQEDYDKIVQEVVYLNDARRPQFQVQASMKLEKRGAAAVTAIVDFVKTRGHNELSLVGTELLGRIPDARLADLCAELVADRDFFWRPMAMQSLARQKSAKHVEVYRKALADHIWGVRQYGILGLEHVGDRGSRDAVAKRLDDEIYDVRAQAAKTLFAWNDPSGLPVLVESLRSNVAWFDIDYGQLAREDAWNFLKKIVLAEGKLLEKHEARVLAAFREEEGREPEEDELRKLKVRATSDAHEEASLGFKPWDGEKSRAPGLARWDAWMDARDPAWRTQVPPNARVTPDAATYTFGFELRSCQFGDFFFRIDAENNLVLGHFNLVRAKLTPQELEALGKAMKLLDEVDRGVPYGEGGCDFEQYYLRENDKFSKIWIGRRGRPPELDPFIRTLRELIRGKFGEAAAIEFKERTSVFRGPD